MTLVVRAAAAGVGVRQAAQHRVLLQAAVVVAELERLRILAATEEQTDDVTGVFIVRVLVLRVRTIDLRRQADVGSSLGERFDHVELRGVDCVRRRTRHGLGRGVAERAALALVVDDVLALKVLRAVVAHACEAVVVVVRAVADQRLSGRLERIVARGAFFDPVVAGIGLELQLVANLVLRRETFRRVVVVPHVVCDAVEGILHLADDQVQTLDRLRRMVVDVGEVDEDRLLAAATGQRLIAGDRISAAVFEAAGGQAEPGVDVGVDLGGDAGAQAQAVALLHVVLGFIIDALVAVAHVAFQLHRVIPLLSVRGAGNHGRTCRKGDHGFPHELSLLSDPATVGFGSAYGCPIRSESL